MDGLMRSQWHSKGIPARRTRWRGAGLLGALLPLAIALPVRAHGADILQIELHEQSAARYEWKVNPPANLETIALPQLPERCEEIEPPAAPGDGDVLTFAIDCGGQRLGDSDAIRFSGAADGAMVVAYWLDGTSNSRFYPAEAESVGIAIAALRQQEAFPGNTVRFYTRFGLRHGWLDWNHVAIALAVAVAARSWQRLRWLSAFALGQGAAVGWIAVTGAGLALFPAEVAISVASVALALWAWRDRDREEGKSTNIDRGTGVLLGGLGFWHGLGVASTLIGAGTPTAVTLFGLTAFVVGMDGAQLALVAGFSGAIAIARKLARPAIAYRFASVAACGLCVAGFALTQTRRDAAFSIPNLLTASPSSAGQTARPTKSADEALAAPSGSEIANSTAIASATSAPVARASDPDIASFLTVDPYEVRHDILVSAEVVLDWMQPEAIAGAVIEVGQQDALKELVGERFSQASRVTINGEAIAPIVDRVDFVTIGENGQPVVPETPVPQAIADAQFGIVLAYVPTELPQSVTLTWQDFPREAIATTVSDPENVTRARLTTAQPSTQWQNTADVLTLPVVEAIEVAPPQVTVPLLSIALILMALGLEVRLRKQEKSSYKTAYLAGLRLLVPLAIVVYPVAAWSATLPFGLRSNLSQTQASTVLNGLLSNVYRAFEFRDESDIYDKLALSVTGDELTDVYLDSRRSLEVENQGGARARVEQVDVTEVKGIHVGADGQITLQAQWQVGGSVSHLGHTHFRHNQYEALIAIAVEDDVWKIVDIEVVDEHRLL
ncbi:MAG: HupE/UreJ family protein [Cyanobacteria bacterium J06639_1]